MNRLLRSYYVQRSIGGAISLLVALFMPIFTLLILVEARNAARDQASPPDLV
jgi:hypothetical protein